MKRLILSLLMISVLCFTGCANSCTNSSDNSFEYIMDQAKVLNDEQRQDLTRLLSDYEKKSKVQMAAILVDSTNEQNIDDYSLEQFGKIGIGQRETNNGALIVIAVKDRTARISLGYGLEWCISDEVADEIFAKMIPTMKENKFYEALATGFNEIIKYIGNTSWEVEYKDIKKAKSEKENAVSKILSVKVKSVKKDGAGLVAVTSNGGNVIINTTEHMDDLVGLITKGDVIVTGRIKDVEPFSMNLLSVQKG